MEEETPRLALPMLAAGQAQKELTHNEALTRLDIAVHAAVEEVGRNDPPEQPAAGQCWIVGSAAKGAWVGQAHALAGWTEGGWRFVAPRAGMRVWNGATASEARYDEPGGWTAGRLTGSLVVLNGVQVVGEQGSAIEAPTGGEAIDVQARRAIDEIIGALRTHGLIAS